MNIRKNISTTSKLEWSAATGMPLGIQHASRPPPACLTFGKSSCIDFRENVRLNLQAKYQLVELVI